MSSRTGKNNSLEESRIYSSITLREIEKAFNDKTYIWNSDGSVSQIIKFSGMNNSAFSAEKYNEVYSMIATTLQRLDSQEISVAFYQVRNSQVELKNIPLDMPVQLLEREKFLKKLVANNEIFANHFYIAVNSMPNKDSLSLYDKFKSTYQSAMAVFTGKEDMVKLNSLFANIKKRLKDVSRTVITLTSMLESLDVNHHVLEERSENRDLFRTILAPFKSTIKNMGEIKAEESLRKELFAGVECKADSADHFILDGYFHQIYELDRIPSQTIVKENDISSLVDAPFEHIFGTVFRVMSPKETNKTMQSIIKDSDKQIELAKDARGNVDDFNLIEDRKRFEEAYHHTANMGTNTIEFSSFFVFRKKYKDVIKYAKSQSMDLQDYMLENTEMLMQNYFGKFGLSEWNLVDSNPWDAFCSYLPGMSNIKSRKFKTIVDLPINIAYLLPFFNRSRDDLQYCGINHFFTDSLTTETFELVDPSQASWGYLISGDMGTGKSVTLNLLISMALKSKIITGKNPITRIIDYGGVTSSYFKLLKMMKGEHINFSKRKKPSIQIMELICEISYPNDYKIDKIYKAIKGKVNLEGLNSEDEKYRHCYEAINGFYEELMDYEGKVTDEVKVRKLADFFPAIADVETVKLFDLNPGECRPNTDKFKSLMAIFEIMLSADPTSLDAFKRDFNRDDFSFFVNKAYEEVNDRFPKISDIVKVMNDYNDIEPNDVVKSMISRLSKFTYKGDYKMFDRETDINLENDFIMFDLFGLASDPHLEAIYLLVITDLISNDMYTKQDRERVCVLDETWASLKTKAMREVIVGFFRLSRKYRFAPMLASQLPTDFFDIDPTDGKVIVSQATNYIFCGLSDPTVAAETAMYYNLDDNSRDELLKLGVHTKGGTKHAPVYSRFMHVQKTKGEKRRINLSRNVLSPFEYQLYSSSKEDNAIFRYFLNERDMSVEDTCFYLAENKHIGDKGLIEHLKQTNNPEALRVVDK